MPSAAASGHRSKFEISLSIIARMIEATVLRVGLDGRHRAVRPDQQREEETVHPRCWRPRRHDVAGVAETPEGGATCSSYASLRARGPTLPDSAGHRREGTRRWSGRGRARVPTDGPWGQEGPQIGQPPPGGAPGRRRDGAALDEGKRSRTSSSSRSDDREGSAAWAVPSGDRLAPVTEPTGAIDRQFGGRRPRHTVGRGRGTAKRIVEQYVLDVTERRGRAGHRLRARAAGAVDPRDVWVRSIPIPGDTAWFLAGYGGRGGLLRGRGPRSPQRRRLQPRGHSGRSPDHGRHPGGLPPSDHGARLRCDG